MPPHALWFTPDPDAAKLLAEDPFALLVGFAIDQQVPVPKAFIGPYVLKQRAGTLEPKKLAKMDLGPVFAEKPAIHRFPGAMAERVRELAAVVADEYGGDKDGNADATVYRSPSGAYVFASGSHQFSWGLTDFPWDAAEGHGLADPRLQRFVTNMFDSFVGRG